jgi:quinol monooxygenase YgiN
VALLLGGQEGLRAAGCELYAVGTAPGEPDLVRVQEIWLSKAHHDASLELPGTKAAIAAAMPMLTGELTGQEIDIVGGLGIADGTGAAVARPAAAEPTAADPAAVGPEDQPWAAG